MIGAFKKEKEMKLVTIFRVVATGIPDGYGLTDVPIAEFSAYEEAEYYLENAIDELIKRFDKKTMYRIDKVRAIL